MRKILGGVFSLILLSGCGASNTSSFFSSLPAGVSLVDEVDATPGSVTIDYKKYKLANGLTVILSPDHSDPLVNVNVTYHVGSAREEVGKSGFAHFFEHMMFQGSKHVGDQEHFRLITEAGGTLNGTTDRDKTHYFETVPANQLEKVLWLESDRMGFLLDAVSQKKFEIQRSTVKNERAQNYDNRPYGLMWIKMAEAMYPVNHPYSWPTIGYVSDLNQVNVNDLKAFFLRWYGPNNAILTIGGDFDEQQTLAWVAKYFGSIPKGPDVPKMPKQPATLDRDRFLTLQDRIQQPMVLIGWPTSYLGAKDQVTQEVLATALGQGANSILYRDLVKTQKAVSAGSFVDCGELACTFYVYAMAPAGEKGHLKPLYHDVMQSLDRFSKEGISPSLLNQINGMAESSAIFGLQSVQGKVNELAFNETFFGQPDRIQQELADIRSVTAKKVASVYQQYLANKPKVVLSVVPKHREDLAAHKADFTPQERQLPDYKVMQDNELAYRHVNDDFDRSIMPTPASAVTIHTAKTYKAYYANGAELVGQQTNETPTVLIRMSLPAGERYAPLGKEGLAGMTATMVSQGSKQHSIEELQAKLDTLGADISIDAGEYTTQITVSSLTSKLLPTLDILQEVLFEPRFSEQDFAREKQRLLQGIMYQQQTPGWLAAQATRQVLFGDTLFARESSGTSESIQALTLEDVKAFYRQYYTPKGAQLVVVGDLSKEQARKQLSFVQNWNGKNVPLLRPQALPEIKGQKIYLVDKPKASQSVVRFVRRGLPYDAIGESFLSELANFNLAGNFNSRINLNLREDKGYTYGAGSNFISNRETGAIIFYANVRADATANSIVEIRKELAQYSEHGPTGDEVKFMRLALGQQQALANETPNQKARVLSRLVTYSLDDDYIQQQNELVQSVDRKTLTHLANKWFKPEDYQIIVVGDAQSLRPQLEKLNIPVEQLEISR